MRFRDYFGRELSVGDNIAFIETNYKEFGYGTIIKLNGQKATIKRMERDKVVFKYYYQIIKEPVQE